MMIYHKIMEGKNRESFGILEKITKYARVGTYGLAIALFSFFGLSQINTTTNTNIDFSKTFEDNTQFRAQANTRIRIVEFQGSYSLQDKKGNFLQTNIIFPNDVIRLEAWAIIKVNVDGSDLKMVWPAVVRLEESTEEGKYIMKFEQDPSYTEIIEHDTQSQLAIIKQDDIIIKRAANADKMEVQITKTTENTKIENHGDAIELKNNDNQKTVTLQSKQQVVLEKTAEQAKQKDLPTPSELQKLVAFLDDNTTEKWNNEQSPSVELNEKTKNNTTKTVQQDKTNNDNNASNTIQKEAEESKNTEKLTINDKKVPTAEQIKTMKSLVNTSFIEYEIVNIIDSLLAENDNKKTIAFNNMNARLLNIGKNFGIELIKIATLSNMEANANRLIIEIPQQYHVPPSDINKIIVMKQRIKTLANKEIKQNQGSEIPEAKTIMEGLKKEQRNLQFLD